MIGAGIAFNPCCKCDEKAKCNICELTYRRNGQLLHHADVEEVRHGYWNKRTVYPMGYNCSECNNAENYKSPFCRLCGAKMDGERREQNEG